jgi:hypothetical protein
MKQRDFLKMALLQRRQPWPIGSPEAWSRSAVIQATAKVMNFAPQASTRRHCLDGCRVRSNPVIVLHKRLMIVSVESSGFHRVV